MRPRTRRSRRRVRLPPLDGCARRRRVAPCAGGHRGSDHRDALPLLLAHTRRVRAGNGPAAAGRAGARSAGTERYVADDRRALPRRLADGHPCDRARNNPRARRARFAQSAGHRPPRPSRVRPRRSQRARRHADRARSDGPQADRCRPPAVPGFELCRPRLAAQPRPTPSHHSPRSHCLRQCELLPIICALAALSAGDAARARAR